MGAFCGPFHLLRHQMWALQGRRVPDEAASGLGFPQSSSRLRELAFLHGFCLDRQALGTDGEDHDENTHHKRHHRPEEAVQEDNLIVCTLEEDIFRSAREWRAGKEDQSVSQPSKLYTTRRRVLSGPGEIITLESEDSDCRQHSSLLQTQCQKL